MMHPLRRSALLYLRLTPFRHFPFLPVPQSSVLPVLPSPDRSSSCGGAGLGAPVIPPSRAGFPLRPRPLEGLGVSSPPGRSATTCGAGSCPGWRGSLCPLPGRLGGGGVCRYNGLCPKPRGSRGWYGARGLTPPPYSVGYPWGATGDWRSGRTLTVGLWRRSVWTST